MNEAKTPQVQVTAALVVCVMLASVVQLGCSTLREPPRTAGDMFRDCAECPQMVVVPAGSYRMGSPPDAKEQDVDEGPVREVTIAAPFAVGKYEVTFAEWDACFRAGGCPRVKREGVEEGIAADYGWGRDSRPVINVSWRNAQEYVTWLSRKTKKMYRLPSESEWEYAARAGTTTARYWGDDVSGQCRHENGLDIDLQNEKHFKRDFPDLVPCGDKHVDATAPVGSYTANGWGLHDMLGNVMEWTQDCWNSSHAEAPADGGARESGDCTEGVVRGGSWNTTPFLLRAASRHGNTIDTRSSIIGFRVARTLAP